MEKSTSIRTILHDPKCTICSEPVKNYHSVRHVHLFPICHSHRVAQEALKVALCPSGSCKAISHLSCLATDFLSSDSSQSLELLPRGGNCKYCKSYVLWGDVIRGCYRRHQGGKAPELEESNGEEDGVEAEAQSDDPMEDLVPIIPMAPAPRKTPRSRVARDGTVKKPRGRPPKNPPSTRPTTKRATVVTEDDSGGENFDIGGFTDLDDSEGEVERRPPKPTPVRQGK